MRIKYLLSLLALLFITSCQSGIDESPLEDQSKLTSLENEPLLQQMLAELKDSHKGAAASENSSAILSEVDWKTVRKLHQPNIGRTAYSAATWKSEAGNIFLENLVIVKRPSQNYYYVIRYTPVDGWLKNHSISNDLNNRVTHLVLNYL